MRLKLTENLNHNNGHAEAARERDVALAPDMEKNKAPSSPLGSLVVSGGGVDDEQVFSDEDTMSPNEDEEDDEKPADAR